ncbi:hypothetical protein [Umezawaea sp. Da 62-37]|uniref:hypothetical protein n=1 Tax=Umezawaea sp. Da 62-37 TaxID=3075927 RepID=UPI0028F72D34|nr:hypothetical protein [Umezawaea sp. Da 62-37]WNV87489.1 hypothetical protein RM788_04070 [Umezawaea sp. Da 62-37]
MLKWHLRADRTYLINLDGPVGPVIGCGNDLFQALQVIRLELETSGWLIAVQGARKDAYASGMVRDMIGASRIYILRTGQQVEREHLVDIFAEAPPDSLGTVEQQKSCYRDWRLSLT